MRFNQLINLSRMLYIENTTKDLLERVPEPDLIMDNSKSVEAFDQQGSPGGALIPIYKYCARAISKRIPKNGTLLDLGSGSGQFLIYLAHKRPDISITGIDLSDAMVERGNYNIEKNNLSHQITLKVADMTSFSQHVDKNLNLITSVFSLHHLPQLSDLNKCFLEVHLAKSHTQCSFWAFDHIRPKHPSTPDLFPIVFTPQTPLEFREDSKNSLKASWSYEEVSTQLHIFKDCKVSHRQLPILRLYQTFFVV